MTRSLDPPRHSLLDGPVSSTLLRASYQMMWGMLAVMLFNIVDTFYIGQLGTDPLAAVSFTFPVAFFVTALTMGVGLGVSSVISRAIGRGDRRRVRRLATDALLLTGLLVTSLVAIGLPSIDPIFRQLGADDEALALVRDYMVPWFLGVPLLMVPMVGNSAIRATGDMKSPSLIMAIAGVVNLVLDPFLIFGIGPFPRWEVFGAAVASVTSWGVTFAASLWILGWRERMLELARPKLAEVLVSWRSILEVGIPGAATNLMVPLAGAALTRLVASFGNASIAAFGVGTRLESLAMIGVYSLAVALIPLLGQCYGAGRWDRVRDALRFSFLACVALGLLSALVLGLAARPLARLFNDDPAVVEVAARYLWILPVSYVGLGISMLSAGAFSALVRPSRTALIAFVRLFILSVPLAWLGSRLWGTNGLFVGMAAANLIGGGFAMTLILRHVRRESERADRDGDGPPANTAPLPASQGQGIDVIDPAAAG